MYYSPKYRVGNRFDMSNVDETTSIDVLLAITS